MCSKKKAFAERCQVSWPFKETVSFVTRSHVSRLLPGVTDAVYGDLVGHSDFELNLRPPEESTHDIEVSLDSIMNLENAKMKSSNDDFSAEQENMLHAEKEAIHNLVVSAFQPLFKLR